MLIHSMNSAVKAVETYSKVQTKANAYKALCCLRTAGIRIITAYVTNKEKYHCANRTMSKASEVLPENVRVVLPNPYQSAVDLNRKQMIVIGNMMVLMLDVWQRLGGTFDELCLTVAFSILTKTVKHTTLIKTVLEYETQK